jgi:hypothetical protein
MATASFTTEEVIASFAQTNGAKKIYQATFAPKSIPSEVHEQFVLEVTEKYDRFTKEYADAEYTPRRIKFRDENIANEVRNQEWHWLYERNTQSCFTANSKSEAEKIARLRAKQINKHLVYVYVAAK